jgi:hypothetical protein
MAADPGASSSFMLSIGDNYNDWRTQIFQYLCAISRRDGLSYSDGLHMAITELHRGQEGFREQSAQAAVIIFAHVSIDILQRVPSDIAMDAPRLLLALQSLCKPFNLMGIPVEVRHQIYSFLPGFAVKQSKTTVAFILASERAVWTKAVENGTATADGQETEYVVLDLAQPNTYQREQKAFTQMKSKALGGRFNIMPPITQVSTTIRAETARDIYQDSVLVLEFVYPTPIPLVYHTLRTWFSEVAQPHAHLIKKIYVERRAVRGAPGYQSTSL